ncbi:MAG: DNA mismatch repair protein MutS [Spirochaetales bacterium]|nr:DNA mismatch repair protein MutS [Spirochaetales bacterium]
MTKKNRSRPVAKDSQKESPSARKEPVVLGYDPAADFGDILESWERSGTLEGVTKRMKRSEDATFSRSFGEILEEWENRDKKPKRRKPSEPVRKSAPYKPTKDFGALLEEFEGTRKPPAPKKAEQQPKKKHAPKKLVASVEVEEALQGRKEGTASWSFADTYRRWNEISDEESAVKKAAKEKAKKTRSEEPTLSVLRTMQPEVTLDLHGMTVGEAELEAKAFLATAAEHRIRKLAFIVGKGLHNDVGYSLIREEVERILRLSRSVREFFTPPARYGGSGVIWVILKG